MLEDKVTADKINELDAYDRSTQQTTPWQEGYGGHIQDPEVIREANEKDQ